MPLPGQGRTPRTPWSVVRRRATAGNAAFLVGGMRTEILSELSAFPGRWHIVYALHGCLNRPHDPPCHTHDDSLLLGRAGPSCG